jgi:glutamate racemase
MAQLDAGSPIGVFDSGVGGLSVLRAIWRELPGESIIYLADQANVPYGDRTPQEVRHFSKEITNYLLAQGAKLIVVACNTASAAALHYLRRTFNRVPFVGMEPAVKPASEQTTSKVVGVLATPATFQGALYGSVVERFANGVELLQDTCPGLVGKIEAGLLDSPDTVAILEDALRPMLGRGIDTVVLGCTHYPFVIPLIQDIAGPGVRVIDPAPAVARQTRSLLDEFQLENPDSKQRSISRFITTGDAKRLEALILHLLDLQAEVRGISWYGERLQLPTDLKSLEDQSPAR